MQFHLSIRTIILNTIYILIVGSFVGYVLGHTLVVIALVMLGLLIWHYTHLIKLVNWLWQGKSIAPPQAKGIWGYIYDGLYLRIKKQRVKQKQLSDRLRKYRDAAEALPDAAVVLTTDLSIIWSNKKASLLIGIHSPKDNGQRIDNLLRSPEFVHYLNVSNYEKPCIISSPFNVEIQIELRMMSYGFDQILLIARDISTEKRLEEMRRDFVANVSHELKTPLTVVRGYIEMMQMNDDLLSPHWNKAFNTIENQVERMDRLVEQLLSLSRVENNIDVENYQTIDLSKLILTILEDIKWLNNEKQHEIKHDIAKGISVLGSEHELKSAFLNLISNAITYTPHQGTITIRLQQDQNNIIFSVEDNGTGISVDDLQHLTERFFRVDKSRSRQTGGAGLGLAIVKHVITHHQGELVINSELGKGSQFSIFLPLNKH